MYYIFLLIAVVLIGIQFSLMKVFQKSAGQTLLISLVFSAISSLVTALAFFIYNGFKLQISSYTAVCALVYAVLLILTSVLGIKALSLGNMSIYSMFMMMGGMIIPFFFGVFYLSESISPLQIVGVITLALALVLPCIKSKGKKLTPSFIIICILIFFANGSVSIVSKLQQTSPSAVGAPDFAMLGNLFTVGISIVCIALFCVVNYKKPDNKIKAQCLTTLRHTPLIAGYSVVVGAGFLLILLSAANLPASVQYPILSGGVVVLSAIIDRVIFKEKLSMLTYISIIIAFAATVLLMF